MLDHTVLVFSIWSFWLSQQLNAQVAAPPPEETVLDLSGSRSTLKKLHHQISLVAAPTHTLKKLYHQVQFDIISFHSDI